MVLLSQTEYPLVSGLQSIFQDDQGGVIYEGIFSIWSHPEKNEPNEFPSTFHFCRIHWIITSNDFSQIISKKQNNDFINIEKSKKFREK